MGRRRRGRWKRERAWTDRAEDEPWPDPADLVEYGGQTILAMGFTSGGAPYGSTLADFRESMAAGEARRGWARAKRALRAAVLSEGLPEPHVGRVRQVGRGLGRRVFAAEVDTGTRGGSRVLAALVPHGHASGHEPQDVQREARLLRFLAGLNLPFRVPRFAECVTAEDGAVLVCEYCEGIPADLRVGRTFRTTPWTLVASIAAGVHGIPCTDLEWLPGHATRREHGEHLVDELADLADATDRVVPAALRWLRAHLPPREPARLVHGDLLGQNLLVLPDKVTAVLDWERAFRGDPAHDLAVVTRGVRRPFQSPVGMPELLAAYAEEGGCGVSEEEVRFHEIGMHLRWYRAAVSGKDGVEQVEGVLGRLRNLARAVGAEG